MDLSFVPHARNPDPTQDVKHQALAIVETNAAVIADGIGIFPRMARLNHGCSSAFNAVYTWRETEGVLLIHALKSIARGSEVLTAYVQTNVPRSQRRWYLEEHYGFRCTCSVCALPDAASQASDARLAAMAEHHRALQTGWADGTISGADAIRHIRAIWALGEEEGYWSERGRLAADAVVVAASHADARAVREWGLLSLKWYAYELGADSPLLSDIEAAVVQPSSHRAWNQRERMRVGDPHNIR